MAQPHSAGGQPTSFKTNVNRAKTKRWVEAKSYSYDGDDWGEVDDYDEYGGYNEPQAPPKPTGRRQQGQSATQMPHEAYNNQPDMYQDPMNRQHGYGNLGGATSAQRQYGGHDTGSPGLARSNSFRRGDERRAFSAGGPQQRSPDAHIETFDQPRRSQEQPYATGFSQIEHDTRSTNIPFAGGVQSPASYFPNQPPHIQPDPPRPPLQVQTRLGLEDQSQNVELAHSPGGNHRGVSYSEQTRHPSLGSRAQSMGSNTSSVDYHTRRDFSPSAMPPPLQTRGSPSPHSASESQSSLWHPPRKSSLSQHGPSTAPVLSQPPQASTIGDPEDSKAPLRERASSNTSKSLPFVRPADIYKRMQDERERDRRSQDSSRPSADATMGREANSMSARSGERTSTDTPGTGSQRRTSLESPNDADNIQRLKSTLDPVSERRSEYGFDGYSTKDKALGREERRAGSESIERTVPKSNLGLPMLPDVTRMSGFGESFLRPTAQEDPQLQSANEGSKSQLSPDGTFHHTTGSDLQHQPSVGFRSAVHQAFDTSQDQVPPTPSSMADSTIGRSTSGGTSTVSPITISRGPSTAVATRNAVDIYARPATPPLHTEEVDSGGSRPTSLSSPGTPQQTVRKPSPSQIITTRSSDARPASFIPGHRRDLSTPSPKNSPARTPALEANSQLKQPQEAELAITTPRDPKFPTSTSSQNMDVILSRDRFPGNANFLPEANSIPIQRKKILIDSPILPPGVSSGSRAGSPSSSRVRDLAGKFEGAAGSRRGSDLSLNQRNDPPSTNPQNDNFAQPRPVAERVESFRPRLPGGWDSYAPDAPSVVPHKLDLFTTGETQAIKPFQTQDTASTPNATEYTSSEDRNATPVPGERGLSEPEDKNPLSNPFSAVAGAGAALAGALVAAVGLDNQVSTESDNASPTDAHQASIVSENSKALESVYTGSRDMRIQSEVSRHFISTPMDTPTLSVAPTPASGDIPKLSDETAESLDYFPPIVPLKPKPGSHNKNDEGTTAIQRPPMPPSLSTDTGSQYESDRLRREIVKNLDPGQSSEPTTAESGSPWQDDSRLSANPSLTRQGHESMVLPSEYDSYWNGSSSGKSSRTNSGHGRFEAQVIAKNHTGAALISNTPPRTLVNENQRTPSEDLGRSGSMQARPDMLPHRFSWEEASANAAVASRGESSKANLPQTLSSMSYAPSHVDNVEPPNISYRQNGSPDGTGSVTRGILPAYETSPGPMVHSSGSGEPDITVIDRHPGKEAVMLDLDDTESRPSGRQSSNFVGADRLLVSHPGVPEPAEPLLEKQEIDRSDVREHANRLDDMHPDVLQQEKGEMLDPSAEKAYPKSDRDATFPPPLPPSANLPKIRPFREILALKNPVDRIRALNETREQFANMNTGLAHWLQVTTSGLPEHAGLLSNNGRIGTGAPGHKPSPSRAKLAGLRTTGGQSLHQPYYQQYLNATSQPTASDGTTPSNYPSNNSAQGFSPSGATKVKLSSQQVQAKGKDLLQTAGVFGGKANVAAKGLFSKGRNRLKAAGADKATTSTPSLKPIPPRMQPQLQPQTELYPKAPSFQIPTLSEAQKPLDFSGFPSTLPRQSSIAPPSETRSLVANQSHEPYRYTPFPSDQVRNDDRVPSFSSRLDKSESSTLEQPLRQPESSSDRQEPAQAESQAAQLSSNSNQQALSNAAPSDSQQKNAKDLYLGSQAGRSSSPPNTRSMKTSTQADFVNSAQDPSHMLTSEATNERPYLEHELELESNREAPSNDDFMNHPTEAGKINETLFRLPQSRYSTQKLSTGDQHSIVSTGQYPLEQTIPQKAFKESDDAFRTTNGGKPLTIRSVVDSPTIPRAESQQTLQEQPAQRQFSSTNNTHKQLARQSIEDSQRIPSVDSFPSHTYADRAPSPVSPQHSVVLRDRERRGGRAPIHHGTDYDFLPGDEQVVGERRSGSFSHSLRNPNLDEHPAFRGGHPAIGGTDIPTQYYPAQMSREEAQMPGQYSTEYPLNGVRPPVAQPIDSRIRSRAGSKSSSFLKRLSTHSRPDLPHLPDSLMDNSEPPDVASSLQSPVAGQRKVKRASLFRSLTRNIGNDHYQSGEGEVASTPTSGNDSPRKLSQVAPQSTQRTSPSRGASNKPRNSLLQRASTSAFSEQEGGKKKRFSSIGSLFSRSTGSRPKSTIQATHSQLPSQQTFPSTQPQSQTPYDRPPMLPNQAIGFYPQRQDSVQPPPPQGGYYAPSHSNFQNHPDFPAGQSPTTAQKPPTPLAPARQQQASHSRVPEPPAYVQDFALRQSMSLQPQNSTTGAPHDSAWTRHRSSNSSNSPTRFRTSIFSRSKSRDKSSEERSHNHNNGSLSQDPQTPMQNFQDQRGFYESPSSQRSGPPNEAFSPTNINNYRPPTHPPLPRQPYDIPPQPTQQCTTYRPRTREDSPPPPPPPPKDEWRLSSQPHQTSHPHPTQNPSPSYSISHLPPFPLQTPPPNPPLTHSRHPSHASLPPLQTTIATVPTPSAQKSTPTPTATSAESRKARQLEIERGVGAPLSATTPARNDDGMQNVGTHPGGVERGDVNGEERVVMSSTSYPGQEWQPESLGGWDGG